MKLRVLQLCALIVLVLLAVSPAFNISVKAQNVTFSNPSVIPGAQAPLNGPRVDAIKFTPFATDSAAFGSVLSGQNQIMDVEPTSLSDVQTALSTNFLNVTSEAGNTFDFIAFNMYSARDAGYYLPFRQAIAHLENYTYIQNTILTGIAGIANPAIFLPSAFGNQWVPKNYTVYGFSLAEANQSLSFDPQIAYSATDNKPAASNTIACNGSPGVWEYATSLGSGKPNGTAIEPIYIVRNDDPLRFLAGQDLWQTAAKIGLCLTMQQAHGIAVVIPIVYNQYDDQWAMYGAKSSYPGIFDPLANSRPEFTKAGWSTPQANTEHFDNATISQYLNNAYFTANVTYAEQQFSLGVSLLQQQIPQVYLWWSNLIIPSLNNFNGHYWSGYVDVPGISTWGGADAFNEGLSIHRVDPSTGKTIPGGILGVTQHAPPDGFNILSDNSVYDVDIYNQLYDSGEIFTPGNPTLGGLIPWMFNGAPSFQTNLNETTPHGYRMVNGMAVTLNFLNNITFVDNVPMTAADYNFSMWYQNINGASYNSTTGVCSVPCWKNYANNVAVRLIGGVPDLIDSVVNSTYTMTVYMNGSGIEDLVGATGNLVIPEHLWSHVNSTYLNNNDAGLTDASGKVNGISLMAGSGPFYFGSYVPGQYTIIHRNPGYFKTDIWDWAINGSGSQVPVSFNITQMGTPIPSNANVKAWLLSKGTAIPSTSTSLSLTGGSWTGNIPTNSLSSGFYEIVVNGTYTDTTGLNHTALQFWGLNLGQVSGATSTTVSTTSQTAATSATSATSGTQSTSSNTSTSSSVVSTSSTIATSSSLSTSSSTSTGSSLTLIAAAVVVVIIVIAGVAAYLVRRPKTTSTTAKT